MMCIALKVTRLNGTFFKKGHKTYFQLKKNLKKTLWIVRPFNNKIIYLKKPG